MLEQQQLQFTGTNSIDFTINPQDVDDFELVLEYSTIVYNNVDFEPSFTLTWTDKSYVLNNNGALDEYEVSYTNNRNQGTATVTVSGRNNYGGSVSADFTILARAITSVSLNTVEGTYTRSDQPIEVTEILAGGLNVDLNTKVVTYYRQDTNSNWVETNDIATAGVVKVVVGSTDPNFTGTAESFYTIHKRSILDESVTVEYYTNNGTEQVVARSQFTNGTRSIVTYDGFNQTFVGQEVFARVIYNNINLVNPTEISYTYEYTDDEDTTPYAATNTYSSVGAYKITLTASENFEGTDYIIYVVNELEFNATNIRVNITPSFIYTGDAITLEASDITVADSVNGTTALTTFAFSDLIITYSNNKNVGVASVFISTNKAGYSGDVITKTFIITPRDIATAGFDFNVANETRIYNITAYTPNITVHSFTYNENLFNLVEGEDFTVGGTIEEGGVDVTYAGYTNNTQAGTATVTIIGIGNFTGKYQFTFEIGKKNINDLTVAGYEALLEYNGQNQKQVPTITFTNTDDVVEVLRAGTEFSVARYEKKDGANWVTTTDVITKGEYRVVIAADENNYTGTLYVEYEIYARIISSVELDEAFTNAIYNRTPQDPTDTLIVKDNKGDVVTGEGTNYTLSFAVTDVDGNTSSVEPDWTGVMTVVITVTGQGNYSSSQTVTYTISPKPLEDEMVTITTNKTYNGQSQTLDETELVVKDGQATLVIGSNQEYTVTYSADTTNVGTVEVTITGVRNYKGTVVKSYRINERDINTTYINDETLDSKVYTGHELELIQADFEGIFELNGNSLVLGEDFTYSSDRTMVNAGTYTITVTGIRNYKLSKDLTFVIEQQDIGLASSQVAIADIAEQTYTGGAIKPEIVVSDSQRLAEEQILLEDIDFTKTYADNVEELLGAAKTF